MSSNPVSFNVTPGRSDCTICLVEAVHNCWTHGSSRLHPICKKCFDDLAKQAGALKCPTCRGKITTVQGKSAEAFRSFGQGKALCDAVRASDFETVADLLSGGKRLELAQFANRHINAIMRFLGGDLQRFEEISEEEFPDRFRDSAGLMNALAFSLEKIRDQISNQTVSSVDREIYSFLLVSKGFSAQLLTYAYLPFQNQGETLNRLLEDPRFARMSGDDLRAIFKAALRHSRPLAQLLANGTRSDELPSLDKFLLRYSGGILFFLRVALIAMFVSSCRLTITISRREL